MNIRLAIVHDYLTQRGGAEKTVLAMCEAFPDAPVFTSIYSPNETLQEFRGKDIKSTSLQMLYNIFKTHRILLPFYPTTFEHIRFEGFNVILSSSSAFAKGVIKPKGAV
ncbi:MAG: glycosyltransferase family 4 protein, partial [Candidatus Omnitrophica bacterium]|nr:glycosyltransferase family 4 protein [Candidatus Omnitrophota bacterium]